VLTATLSALAEPNRLRIVELLGSGPRPVAQICRRTRLGQPQASKHLRVLRDVGLVQVEPRGQQRFYALRAAPLRELDAWLERFRAIWGERFDQLDKLLRELEREQEKEE
jgi:DNA-binding transcriptional ArsR family regulator